MHKITLPAIVILCLSLYSISTLAGKIIADSAGSSESSHEGSDSDSDMSEESDFEAAVKRNRSAESDEGEDDDKADHKRPRLKLPDSDAAEGPAADVPCEIWQEILKQVSPLDRNHMRLVCELTRRAVGQLRLRHGLTDTLPVVRILGGFTRHFAPLVLNGRMFVVNAGAATITVLDAQTLEPIATIPVPEIPSAPAITNDGRLVVAHPFEMDVTIIDVNTLVPAARTTYTVAPGTTAAGQMALFVAARPGFQELAALPVLQQAQLLGRIGHYEVRLTHIGTAMTTMTLTAPGPHGFRATFNFAFGALLPVLFGYYLFVAEPMSGNIVVIDFRGHL